MFCHRSLLLFFLPFPSLFLRFYDIFWYHPITPIKVLNQCFLRSLNFNLYNCHSRLLFVTTIKNRNHTVYFYREMISFAYLSLNDVRYIWCSIPEYSDIRYLIILFPPLRVFIIKDYFDRNRLTMFIDPKIEIQVKKKNTFNF